MAKNIAKFFFILILIAALCAGCYFAFQYVYVESETGYTDSTGDSSNTEDSTGTDSSSSSDSGSTGTDSGSSSSSSSSDTGSSDTGSTTAKNYLSTETFVYGDASYHIYAAKYTGPLNNYNIAFTSADEPLILVIGIYSNSNPQSVFKAGTEYTVTLTCVDGVLNFNDYLTTYSTADGSSGATKITSITQTSSGLKATFTPEEDISWLTWRTDSSTAGYYNFNLTVTY